MTSLRRGSHEAVLGLNQELEGDSKKSGGPGSLGRSKLRAEITWVRVVEDQVCRRCVSRQGGWKQKPAVAWEVARGREGNE